MEQSKKNLKATEPIFLKKQLKLPNTGGLKGTAFKLFSISKAIIMSWFAVLHAYTDTFFIHFNVHFGPILVTCKANINFSAKEL